MAEKAVSATAIRRSDGGVNLIVTREGVTGVAALGLNDQTEIDAVVRALGGLVPGVARSAVTL